ncbi:MAG: sulfatase-like hydrolase/transferase [Desulfuromonadaceae bacterium]|nr:sulfatase-like hydrolase/transferase [Desulfuromonadaceae bacterium]MDD5104916.1 sulfatase-like hydrolase/transferase [Desulfuromonadaceae bacterium]
MLKSNKILAQKTAFSRSGWFFLFSLVVIFLQTLCYFDFGVASADFDLLTWVFLLLDGPAHFGSLLLLIWLIGFLPWQLLFQGKRFPAIITICLFTLFNIYLVLDILVFKLYKFHINGFVYEMVTGPDANQIFVFDQKLLIKAALAICLIFVTYLLLYGAAGKLRRFSCKWRYIMAFIIACQLLANGMHAWAAAGGSRMIVRVALSYPLNYPLTANSLLIKHGLVDANKQKGLGNLKSTGNILYPRQRVTSADNCTNYNVIFIVIDSWNYRTFEHEVTPEISAFAENSLVFSNHYSGSNGTRGGIFSLFYALPPTYWHNFEAADIHPVMITEMQKKGYQIASFTSASIASPPFHKTVFGTVPGIPLNVGEGTVMERDKLVSDKFIDFIKRPQQKPFFAFLFYDLPHAITFPASYPKKFTPAWDYADYVKLGSSSKETELFFNLYKNCVNYDDMLVGRVLNTLKERKLLDNTIIVITGDHGQEFNENGKNYWGHNGNFSRAQIGVPLIVRIPGAQQRVYEHRTTHFDIVPTVLTLALGVTTPIEDYSMGHLLTDSTPREWHIAGTQENFAVIIGDQMATRNYNGTITYSDLKLNELPKEQVRNAAFLNVIQKSNRFYK